MLQFSRKRSQSAKFTKYTGVENNHLYGSSSDIMDPALMPVLLKRNAEDMQGYLKGLDSWEDDMKKRDQLLKKQKPILKKTLPPVRGQSKPAKTQVTKPAQNKTIEDKKDPIKSYDYNAWSKFDVDAACEDTPSSSSEEEMEVEEDEIIKEDRRKKMADLEKERGNQLFKEGKYTAAVDRYTKAIDYDPTSHILPANRAMALIKLKQYAAAESDCNTSIALEENYLKSWQRRATVRSKLGKLQEAIEDYTYVLKMEPSSKTTIAEIERLKEQLAKQKKTENSSQEDSKDSKDPKFVFPVKRPPHLRSKKPLVRINIEEVGGETANIGSHGNDVLLNQSQAKSSPTPLVSDSSQVIKEMHQQQEQQQQQQQQTALPPLNEQGETKARVQIALPDVPTSSIEFMAQWKVLKTDQQILTQYFQTIPVSKYPVLLNQSLESSVFSDILTILQESYDSSSLLLDVLQWLTKVPRFTVAIMFLSKTDKKKLTCLFERLLSNTTQQETVLQLAKLYSLKLQQSL